ncbi:MAG: hypothetical protein WKG06_02150 [Segetibacter sp.]
MCIQRIKKLACCIKLPYKQHLSYSILSCFFIQQAFASEIIFFKNNAVVWRQQQTITGKLSRFISPTITVYHNDQTLSVPVKKDSTFSFTIDLTDKQNKIWAVAQNGKSVIASDTLHLTLGFHPLPLVKPYAVIHQKRVLLHAVLINNPTKKPLKFFGKMIQEILFL